MVQSKFAALGELAGGIGHEINTPLQIISGKLRKIKRMVPELDEDKERPFQAIENTVEDISKIINNLTRLIRSDAEDHKQIRVKSVIDAVCRAYEQRLQNHGITLERKYEQRSDQLIVGNEVSIVQIVNNLLSNAMHAAREQDIPQVGIDLFESEDGITVEVNDNGPGIPAEIVAKIFQPMFTTKSVGEGTGLGLSLSMRMAHDMGATLSLSQDDRTRFRLVFKKESA